MKRILLIALLVIASALALGSPAMAQRARHPGGRYGWHGDIRHFDYNRWRGGHWWHGTYGGRFGWWWIIGAAWYWYPAPVYPYPAPFIPPGLATGYWYWCDAYQQYYPYATTCPSRWRPVPPH